MSTDDKPFFRFHPGAYERSFEASETPCDVCDRPSVWLYTEGVYTAKSEPKVCARCIADGALKGHLRDERYSMMDMELEASVSPQLEAELNERTPGFATFNPFTWPVRDGTPLAFIGYGDEPEILSHPAARIALEKLCKDFYGEPLDGPMSYGLVFRELDAENFVAVIDLD